MKRMTRIVATAMLTASGVCADTAAQAYTRSCNAHIQVYNARRNMVTTYPKTFSARASMGVYAPNTIRVHAFNRAVACARAAWAGRDTVAMPAECTEESGVYGYVNGTLSSAIATTACAAWHYPADSSIYVTLGVHVWGGKGCGGSRRSHSSHVSLSNVDMGVEIPCD